MTPLKLLTTAALGSLFAATMAKADLLPGRGSGGQRSKCTMVTAKDGQADQEQIDRFVGNAAYSQVSKPTVSKLADGNFRVCAIFTR